MIVGVIPCAGASTRMGAPKALLRTPGGSFLEVIAAAQLQAGCDRVLAVIAPGRAPGAREVERAGAEPVLNPDPSAGPISSLRTAIAALRPSPVLGVLWHPVDHPLVSASVIESLLCVAREGFDPGDEEAPALVVPRWRGDTGHPVLIGSALFDEIEAPSLKGGVRTVTRRHEDRRVYCEAEGPGILQGINTPEEYRAAFGAEP